jgi:ABC-2 type transport system permease protein
MSLPAFRMALRLRLTMTLSAATALIAVQLAVGALFPAVGHMIGQLNVPSSVAQLLGGADYGTITGWFRSEIASIYGPLVIAGVSIASATAITAGEEEDRILALILAYPVTRSRLVTAKAVAVAAMVALIALATWIGMLAGVALGGGGISVSHIAAEAVQLAFFGFAAGAIAIALGAGTGRRTAAVSISAGVTILGWLINSFAPLVSAISWLKYLSPFYYYAGRDPLSRGVDGTGLVVLGLLGLVLTAVAILGFRRRDIRA